MGTVTLRYKHDMDVMIHLLLALGFCYGGQVSAFLESARSCYQCGDSTAPCSAFDLLLGGSTSCPTGTDYCMVDVKVMAGTKSVVKRCVDQPTCYREWYQLSSNRSQCMNFDPARGDNSDLDCHFCCVTDGCNMGYKP